MGYSLLQEDIIHYRKFVNIIYMILMLHQESILKLSMYNPLLIYIKLKSFTITISLNLSKSIISSPVTPKYPYVPFYLQWLSLSLFYLQFYHYSIYINIYTPHTFHKNVNLFYHVILNIIFDQLINNKIITPRNLGVITSWLLMPIIHNIIPHHFTTFCQSYCSINTIWYAH